MQIFVNRVQRQLQPVRHAQLVEEVRGVIADRLFADAQAFGNLLIPQPLTNERYDFSFPLGERGEEYEIYLWDWTTQTKTRIASLSMK